MFEGFYVTTLNSKGANAVTSVGIDFELAKKLSTIDISLINNTSTYSEGINYGVVPHIDNSVSSLVFSINTRNSEHDLRGRNIISISYIFPSDDLEGIFGQANSIYKSVKPVIENIAENYDNTLEGIISENVLKKLNSFSNPETLKTQDNLHSLNGEILIKFYEHGINTLALKSMPLKKEYYFLSDVIFAGLGGHFSKSEFRAEGILPLRGTSKYCFVQGFPVFNKRDNIGNGLACYFIDKEEVPLLFDNWKLVRNEVLSLSQRVHKIYARNPEFKDIFDDNYYLSISKIK